jgi:hypothetical protein
LPTSTATDAGWAALTDWSALPSLKPGRFRMTSGFQRDDIPYLMMVAGNKDFNNFLAVCGGRPALGYQAVDDSVPCDPGLQGYLIASDDRGPGFVSRMLYSAGKPDLSLPSGANTDFGDAVVRIYADDLTVPAYEGRLADWTTGSATPFVPPLTTWTSGTLVSYLPVSYQSKLRILLDNLSTDWTAYYWNVDLQSSGPTRTFDPGAVSGATVASVGSNLRQQSRGAAGMCAWTDTTTVIAAGQTVSLLDRKEGGTIDLLRIGVDGASAAVLAGAVLRVSWDDQPVPAVDLPLAWIFGARHALSSFDTLPMTVVVGGSRTDLTLSLPMPFASHANIALTNVALAPLSVHAEVYGSPVAPSGDWGYLHVAGNERFAPVTVDPIDRNPDSLPPIPADARYCVADLLGRGKYVGTILFANGGVDALAPSITQRPLNFLEGDELGTVDGVLSDHGDGTEESFNAGWYFKDGPYSWLFSSGISLSTDPTTRTGATSMVRWYILGDAIDFEDSLVLEYEYGANRPNTVSNYASVAFYYLK